MDHLKVESYTKQKGKISMFQLETISPKMLDYYVDRSDSLIIDLRTEDEYEKSHIRRAISVPYDTLEECRGFPRDKTLVFYCDRGGASLSAAKQYRKMGYRVRSVIGGFEAYHGRNLVISS